MKAILAAVGSVVVLGGFGVWEHRAHQAGQSREIGVVDPTRIVMKPAPINPDWILEGQPDTRSGEVARTADGSTQVAIWSTTTGRFHWFFQFDETVTILDGEVFIADGDKPERRFGPGDSIVFPVGARTTWRVPVSVRKLAVFKPPLPAPVSSAMRWVRHAKGWLRGEPVQAAASGSTL